MAAGTSNTPTLLTRNDLAYRLGVHPRTVTKWTEEGLPVAERGRGRRPSKYEEASARRWVDAREKAVDGNGKSPNLVAARARKELAQALEAEQRVALRAGKLIPVEEVDRIWSAQIAAVRSRLLALPMALADRVCRVAATEGAAGAETALRDAMYQALTELAGAPAVKARRKRKPAKTRRKPGKPRRTRT